MIETPIVSPKCINKTKGINTAKTGKPLSMITARTSIINKENRKLTPFAKAMETGIK